MATIGFRIDRSTGKPKKGVKVIRPKRATKEQIKNAKKIVKVKPKRVKVAIKVKPRNIKVTRRKKS
jgi:hypothetical protein